MSKIIFNEHKEEIENAIREKLKQSPIENESGFTILDGFMMSPINNEISGNIIVGGPQIPMVAIIGKTSGRVYYFALKALLPELNF